jgi:hypothetical protein
MQLAGPVNSTYLENVAVASIIHIFQPKNFLDLGCYCGALPIMVEDLLSLSGSDCSNKTEWYLLDDFSLLKSIAEFNEAYDKDNHVIHETVHNYCLHLRNPNSKGVLKNFPIPIDGEKLKTVIEGITKMFGASSPNINSISTSLSDLQGTKFDMISFDLFADRYEENLKILELIVNEHLNEKGMIVLDDASPDHPGQLLLLLDAIKTLNLNLIAVAGKRVVLTNTNIKEKNDIIDKIYKIRCYANNDNVHFFWHQEDAGKYGPILKLLPGKL